MADAAEYDMEGAAPGLVIDDDHVQHFIHDNTLHVYDPTVGVFAITRGGVVGVPVAFTVKFSRGGPDVFFYDLIVGGESFAAAIENAVEGGDPLRTGVTDWTPDWLAAFVARFEPLVP